LPKLPANRLVLSRKLEVVLIGPGFGYQVWLPTGEMSGRRAEQGVIQR
jgi:hypothetical protein